MNINYIISIYPNKHTIYSELLPNYLTSGILDTCSFYDQFKTAMAYNSLPFLDLRDSINSQKNVMTLYRRTDTHYNQMGAYFAYRSMMYQLYKETKEIDVFPINTYDSSLDVSYQDNKYGGSGENARNK